MSDEAIEFAFAAIAAGLVVSFIVFAIAVFIWEYF